VSPWATKRLNDVFKGDISKFKVVQVSPSKLNQAGITKTEPGDENNQDISALVGKVDIRKLNKYSQSDPDCYSFSGALCRANQGLMEFVEMFKAPIKILHPLLTATQEGNYNGTEALASIPFNGIVLAHSNEAEWQSFKNNSANEAFIDRICIVKVPYCLRVTDEINIYNKLIQNSSLGDAICVPKTLEILSQFAVLSRIKKLENSSIFSKMRIYDGETLKDIDPKAKSLQEYKDSAGIDEGMSGLSTRFSFKVLSRVFNYDPEEIAANPVHLMRVLEDSIEKEQFAQEKEAKYVDYINSYLKPKYAEYIGKEIQMAYLESYKEYGQNLFDKYIEFADHWLEDKDYRESETGEMFNRDTLNKELEKIEKPAGIVNPKEFRGEVVKFALRIRSTNDGDNPVWTSYEKLKEVIEKKMFSSTEDLLPVISFTKKSNKDEQKKHDEFVNRMVDYGYTEKQIRLLVDWFIRVRKSE
jgi:serine protein kinase